MKNRKLECEIVQDLLPLYLDKKTSEETNLFVEEHLAECECCGQLCEMMNSSFGEELRETQKQEAQKEEHLAGEVQQKKLVLGQKKKTRVRRWRRKMGLRGIIYAYVLLMIVLWLYFVLDLTVFYW